MLKTQEGSYTAYVVEEKGLEVYSKHGAGHGTGDTESQRVMW